MDKKYTDVFTFEKYKDTLKNHISKEKADYDLVDNIDSLYLGLARYGTIKLRKALNNHSFDKKGGMAC